MKKSLIIVGVFLGLITITCLILFIIGLRLYIINKNKDKKKEDMGIGFIIPGGLLIIMIPLFYIDYKFKLRGPMSSLIFLR